MNRPPGRERTRNARRDAIPRRFTCHDQHRRRWAGAHDRTPAVLKARVPRAPARARARGRAPPVARRVLRHTGRRAWRRTPGWKTKSKGGCSSSPTKSCKQCPGRTTCSSTPRRAASLRRHADRRFSRALRRARSERSGRASGTAGSGGDPSARPCRTAETSLSPEPRRRGESPRLMRRSSSRLFGLERAITARNRCPRP